MSLQILRCGGGFSKTVLLVMLLSCAVCRGQTNCDDLSDGSILTNPLQLASTLAAPGLQYPLVSPVLPTSFQPQAFWVADFASLGSPFAALTNYPGQDACGVTQYPLRLVCDVTSGVVAVEYPWSNNVELLEVNGPLTDQLASNYLATVRSWCILHGINYTTTAALISNGVTFLEQPPQLVLDAWVIAATDQAMYATNCAATPATSAGGSSSPAFGFGMLFGTCFLNTNTVFEITAITQDTNQWTTITWAPTCSDDGFVYGVLSASALSTNTPWTGIGSLFGESYSTSFQDRGSVGLSQNFYEIMRLPATVGYNGDPIPSGFVASYDLDLFDTNLDWESPFTGFGYDYLQLYNFGADPTDSSTFPSNFPPPYVLGIWLLNEGTGTNIYDSSLNGFNGALTGSPLPQWTNGVCASALWFSGTNSDAQVLLAPQLSPTNALTLLAWAQVSSNITGTVVSQWTTNGLGGSYSLGYTNSQITFALSQSGAVTSLVGGTTIADGGWHLITGTYDGTQMVVYLDGSVDGTLALTGSVDAVNAPVLIGQLPGILNDVQIYSQALSSDAVATFSTLGDGLPDLWKASYGFPIDGLTVATNSPLGGINNLTAYLYGLDPFAPENSYVVLNGGQLITTNTQISVDASGSPFPLLLASLSSNMTGAIVLSNNVGSLTVTALSGNITNYPIYLQYANANTNAIGNQFTLTVTVDTRPPTLSLCPSGGRTLDLSNPLLTVQYGSMPAAINRSSLTVLINGTNMTSMFSEFATGALGNGSNLVAGSYTWSASISDLAGNTATTSGTFVATGAVNGNAPVMSNLDVGSSLIEMPDTTWYWLQGYLNTTNAIVTATVNGGVAIPMNLRNNCFAYQIPLAWGTNVVVLSAADSSGTNITSTVALIERGNHYQAAITSPVLGTFANNQAQPVSGYVSAFKDAGLPTQVNLVSVTVNGVGTTLGGTDAYNNVTFTTTTNVPVNTDGSPTVLDVTINWSDGSTDPALGAFESCEISYRTQTNAGSIVIFTFPAGSCPNWQAYGIGGTDGGSWFSEFSTNYGESDYNYIIAASNQCVTTTNYNQCVWGGVNLVAGWTNNAVTQPDFALSFGYQDLINTTINSNQTSGEVDYTRGISDGYLTFNVGMNNATNSLVIFNFLGMGATGGNVWTNVLFRQWVTNSWVHPFAPGQYLVNATGGTISSTNFQWQPDPYVSTTMTTNGDGSTYFELTGANQLSFTGFEIDPPLHIIWENAGNLDITGSATNTFIGAIIALSAQLASGLVASNYQWTIPTNTLVAWTPYSQFSLEIPIISTTNSQVGFYWTDSGTKQVQCVVTLTNGQTIMASTTFIENFPSVSMTTTTGVVNVGTNMGPAQIAFGMFSDIATEDVRGISFYISKPTNFFGETEWVQICTLNRKRQLTNSVPRRL